MIKSLPIIISLLEFQQDQSFHKFDIATRFKLAIMLI